ncbi:MAG TPA: CBS domain-containing protein [Acidimicrobiia bacterium]|nr:CBS domain-containing protein [Acidimicrobiia bacterium]
MKLADLISTPPEMCGSDITMAQAAAEMVSAGVGSMGVIDEGKFAGIVTERDVLEAVAKGLDVDSEPVRCCMTRSPDVFSPDTDVYQAAEYLLETGYRHLPVVEDELVGILSIRDVLVGIVDPGRIVEPR